MIDRLLVVGAVSVDRLPDGRRQAGGAVLHGTRAAAAFDIPVATLPLAGPEPEAQAALAELARLGPSRSQSAAVGAAFAIDERADRRVVVVESLPGELRVDPGFVAAQHPTAVLLAPIAAEIAPALFSAVRDIPARAAALQGWLRRPILGPLAPLALAALDRPLLAELAGMDLLVASREDLAAEGADPAGQLAALRAAFGLRPIFVLTAGIDGAWLDAPELGMHHLGVPRVIDAASTIGAGDAFAALLTAGIAAGDDPRAATTAAMARVAELLASRGS